jgi:hypothetical protein
MNQLLVLTTIRFSLLVLSDLIEGLLMRRLFSGLFAWLGSRICLVWSILDLNIFHTLTIMETKSLSSNQFHDYSWF